MRVPRFITGIVFPAGALVSLALAATGLWAIGAPPSSAILPAGLPDLPFHVRLDALSGFFLLLLGGVSFGVSLFAAGYFRDTEGTTLGQLTLQYHVFLASMAFLLAFFGFGAKAGMLPNLSYVKTGVTTLMARQREGWAYIRP